MASIPRNIQGSCARQLPFVWSVSASDKRSVIQCLSTLLYNANLPGFIQGRIYRGPLKSVCVPGLNCYSCPGAVGACPLGSLQSSLSGVILHFPFYVLGLLIIFGVLFGRLICGWACPFGLVQELLYKLPTPKIKLSPALQRFTLLKYVITVLFMVVLPLAYYYADGIGIPAFCKFICPAGILEAALPLAAIKPSIRNALGALFSWKLLLLIIILATSTFIYRPFCRFLCPLGAIYSLFNRLSVYGIKVDLDKCIGCDKCLHHCPMQCRKVGDKECINCGACAEVCPTKAISLGKK